MLTTTTGGVAVLFVCLANQCRSPMAEVLLRGRLAASHPGVVIGSAGLFGGGSPAAPDAVDEMARRGLDLGGHASRAVTADLLAAADLILPMTRRQVSEVALIEPSVLGRTLTLPEVIRRGRVVGRRTASESLVAWSARLTFQRAAADVLRAPETDDIADPMGGPVAGFVATADRLDGLAAELAALAFP